MIKNKMLLKNKYLFYFIIFLFFNINLNSQQIRGTVKCIDLKPLQGVNVVLLPSVRVTFSDEKGMFSLILPADLNSGDSYIQFSKNGYYTNSVSLNKFIKRKDRTIFLVPIEYLTEEISISGLNKEEKKISAPIAENSVSKLEIKETLGANIVEIIDNTPGVHLIGQGGFQATPSIRGFGRKRVLILFDGARITSDRRAGTSASFIPPELIGKIEVVRSSSSVLYGSDAISGIINIKTKSEDVYTSSLNLSYNTSNQRINVGYIYTNQMGKFSLYSGLHYTNADNYNSPSQEISHSGFKNFSGLIDLSYIDEKRAFSLSYFGAFGEDIGKPDRENLSDKYDIYPLQENHFLRLNFKEKKIFRDGEWNTLLFLNPNRIILEKRDESINTILSSNNNSLNFGIKSQIEKSLLKNLTLQLGIDLYAREGLTIDNVKEDLNTKEREVPLTKGRRSDLGFYVTADFSGIKDLDIFGGIRYTFFNISALSGGIQKEKTSNAPSAFLAVNKKFSKNFALFLNLGRAFRLPSLSETFYTGISGRKYMIGNDSLKPESSFNVDGGLKFYSKRTFFAVYGFSYSVKDMIERYKKEESSYTYGNINQGNVYGFEMEFQLFPFKNFELSGHGIYYLGKSTTTKEPLNDVPSPKIFFAGKYIFNKFWVEANFIYSFKKDNPGPAEIINDDYQLLNLKGGYYMSSRLFFYLKIQNSFNTTYYANSDPDIPLAQGLSLSTGIQYNVF